MQLHPGYFASPQRLTSIDWLADHGAVLYEVAHHYLLTGDSAFAERWQEPVLRACEFLRYARALAGHAGVPGVLAPAVDTDRMVPTQSIWGIGWNYKGLTEAVRMLERLGHPRAAEFREEAVQYRETFLAALREATAAMPEWTDPRGERHRLTPYSLSAGGDLTHAFYLDTGPLFLVWAGLLPADDPLMRASLAFFREGPNHALYDPQGNCWQRPVLRREISSCEPCYSWNVYHAWQTGDRQRYLEGLYSLLYGALSPTTWVSCETRHGIYGNVFAAPLLADLVRLAAVDDRLEPGALHLLRLAPRSWLREDRETVFERMPTEYGPVTLAFRLEAGGRKLLVRFEPQWRETPGKVVLHLPPLAGLEEAVLEGRTFKAGPDRSVILSGR